jgi:hypothetical protein
MKIKYSTYNLTDQDLFLGRGLCVSPIQEGNQTEDLKSFCRRFSFAATRTLHWCNLVPTELYPNEKSRMFPPLDEASFWTTHPLDAASLRQCVPDLCALKTLGQTVLMLV